MFEPDQRLSHYRLVERIGAGGMGIVYRAFDERLERDVAIKVLPPGTLEDGEARRRFRKEALILSKLNHANIETIHDFDSQEGVDFLVMELVAGVSLDAKVAAPGLPEPEVLQLGLQLAQGLAAAHDKGIVHRDVKPANLRLTAAGQLKILDFGVALLLDPEGKIATTLASAATRSMDTTGNAIVGTFPYMAPEQVRGEKPDGRTDIYAVGAVLYELATGKRAYPQQGAPQLLDAIMNLPTPSPRAANPRLSAAFDALVLKAMDKDPSRRYQSVGELSVDLQRLLTPSYGRSAAGQGLWRTRTLSGHRGRVFVLALGLVALTAATLLLRRGVWREHFSSAGTPGPLLALAVLPLANLSGDPNQEYFADGMTEQLISNLAQIGGLERVISRTSVMQYKGVTKPVREIAAELNVGAVVEGSVQRFEERVRVTVQLVEAALERTLWADRFESSETDVLKMQDQVARAVARQIRVTLTSGEEERFSREQRVDPDAYDAYLRGLSHLRSELSEPTMQKALEHFESALRIDPGYAPAHAGLANAYYHLSNVFMPARVAMPRAKAAATKALELDSGLAAAHGVLACVTGNYEWNWAAADRGFQRALALEPGNALNHMYYGMHLLATRRFEEASRQLERAVELDPLSAAVRYMTPWPFYLQRRWDELIEANRRLVQLDSLAPGPHFGLGTGYWHRGDQSMGIMELEKALDRSYGTSRYALATLVHAYAGAGNRTAAMAAQRELEAIERDNGYASYCVAAGHVGLGQSDEAMAWLQKAFDERDETMLSIASDPLLDALRQDERFQDLLRRMGLAEE